MLIPVTLIWLGDCAVRLMTYVSILGPSAFEETLTLRWTLYECLFCALVRPSTQNSGGAIDGSRFRVVSWIIQARVWQKTELEDWLRNRYEYTYGSGRKENTCRRVYRYITYYSILQSAITVNNAAVPETFDELGSKIKGMVKTEATAGRLAAWRLNLHTAVLVFNSNTAGAW